MNELLSVILTPLAPEVREAIGRRFAAAVEALDEENELYALCAALQDVPEAFPPGWWLDAAHSRFWLCLKVDWKAFDEVEWQVQAIARSLGLAETFMGAAERRPGAQMPQMPEVLKEAADWLRARGHELLALDTGGDEYLAVPIRLDLLAAAVLAAERRSIGTARF